MIETKIHYGGNSINMKFPCDYNYFDANLLKLGVADMTDTKLYISDISGCDELSFLKNSVVDIEELNSLMHRLNRFEEKDRQKFLAVIKEFDIQDMSVLINTTFNMRKYTLIQDMSSFEKVGKAHYCATHPDMTDKEMLETNFDMIGKKLMNSSSGLMTQYGLLFINEDIPYTIGYDKITLPGDDTENRLLAVRLDYKDKKGYISLPESKYAIGRMIKRMGANSIKECTAGCVAFNTNDGVWQNRFDTILNKEGLHKLNELAKTINYQFNRKEYLTRLSAVTEYAEVSDVESIITLAKNLDHFTYMSGVDDFKDLGKKWIEDNDEYELSLDLEDFFLFDEFGEQIAHDYGAKFLDSGGCVCTDGNITLEDIFNRDNHEDAMSMSGM